MLKNIDRSLSILKLESQYPLRSRKFSNRSMPTFLIEKCGQRSAIDELRLNKLN